MIKLGKVISLLIILFALPSQSIYAGGYTVKQQGSSKITSISNISYQIKQGDDYQLPDFVKAIMTNNSQSDVSVIWNQKAINTNNLGTYKLSGTVKGYKNKVLLTVTVNKKSIEDIAKESKKVLLLNIYNAKNQLIAKGSGFIISNDGKIATNYHVIEYAQSIKAVTSDNKIYTISKVVAYNKNMDIAIVKVDSTIKFPYVKLGNSNGLQLGEEVIAIGSPEGLNNTVSQGIVGGIRYYEDKNKNKMSYIQITAPISHGSSGGALFNALGQVVGITSLGISDGQNLNFAIPINELNTLNANISLSLSEVYKKEHIIIYKDSQYDGDIVDGAKEGIGILTSNNGDKYIGEWVNDKKNGVGQYKESSGFTYEGEYVDDRMAGYGTASWTDGTKYEGDWKDDQRTGEGKFSYANGDVYEGDFINDNKEGKGTLTLISGDVYTGDWKNDKKSGMGHMKLISGFVYDGLFNNNDRNGLGTSSWTNGDHYIGEWKDNNRTGKGAYIYANGCSYVGDFVNNKLEGTGTMIYNDGTFTGLWKNNSRNGIGKFKGNNGAIFNGNYINDKLDGMATMSWQNGDSYVGELKEGQKSGNGVFIWADGKKYDGEWKYDTMNGNGTMTYKNGQIVTGTWINGAHQ